MRRGRPALRATFREKIISVLSCCPYPVTVQTIRQTLLQTTARPISLTTIKKYLEELAAEGIVIHQSLPVDCKKKPLVVYFMRGFRPGLREKSI
jgi:predicted Zn-ribbon and HTH transcriptional regulator